MSNQIALDGFEAPHAKEQAAYDEILPQLRAAASSTGANANDLTIKHGKKYSSVWFGSLLAFRLCLRKSRYIEVPMESRDLVAGIVPSGEQKKMSSGFWRVKLGGDAIENHADVLAKVVIATIDRMPKEWDCCSRYLECSDAKHCVHPDPAFALGCGYRKILNSGKIYYGENRNID